MAIKGGFLKKAGGRDWAEAEPPAEIEDDPKALALQMMADEPILCLLGWTGKDGIVHTISTFGDKFEEMAYLLEMQDVIKNHDDDSA